MCKISAPISVKSSPPLSWDELNKRTFDLDMVTPEGLMQNTIADDCKILGNELFYFNPTSPLESTHSLFPSEYDMSMFGLFPQQETLETIPCLEKDQILFNLPMHSLEESVSVDTLKASSTSTVDSNSDSACGSPKTSYSSASDSPKTAFSAVCISPKTSFDLSSRLQKRKIGNTNAKKSEDGISDDLRRKRQKQREAAKRCREKRMSALQIAEERADKAEAEKLELLVKVRVLEEAKKEWMLKEQDLQQKIFNLGCKMQF